jgi:hypothetical protein
MPARIKVLLTELEARTVQLAIYEFTNRGEDLTGTERAALRVHVKIKDALREKGWATSQ